MAKAEGDHLMKKYNDDVMKQLIGHMAQSSFAMVIKINLLYEVYQYPELVTLGLAMHTFAKRAQFLYEKYSVLDEIEIKHLEEILTDERDYITILFDAIGKKYGLEGM